MKMGGVAKAELLYVIVVGAHLKFEGVGPLSRSTLDKVNGRIEAVKVNVVSLVFGECRGWALGLVA